MPSKFDQELIAEIATDYLTQREQIRNQDVPVFFKSDRLSWNKCQAHGLILDLGFTLNDFYTAVNEIGA